MTLKTLKTLICSLLAAGLLVSAPAASAQAPVDGTYGGQGAAAGQVGEGAGDGDGATLPFTGLDLGLMVAGALVLTASGVLVGRLARGGDTA